MMLNALDKTYVMLDARVTVAIMQGMAWGGDRTESGRKTKETCDWMQS